MAIEPIRSVRGRGLPLRGQNIDTDRIIPARFLRSVSFDGLEQHLFADDIAQDPSHPIADARYAGAAILVVNGNFGCGSSREHAPQAIHRRGFRAVIGESFSEIFFGNSVALGMPCVTASAADIVALQDAITADPQVQISIDIQEGRAQCAERAIVIDLPRAARDAFLDGSWDATALLLDRFEDVERVARELPYLRDFEEGLSRVR